MFDLMQYALIFYDFQLILARMRAEGMAFMATLGLPVLWRSQRKGGEISFHDIMAHSFRMSR